MSTGGGLGEARTHLQKRLLSASVVVLIACTVFGPPMAGAREACKSGFFEEMTRWMEVRTIVSLCLRGRGGLVRSTLLCGEKGWKRGRRWQGGGLVEEEWKLNKSRIVSGLLGGGGSG